MRCALCNGDSNIFYSGKNGDYFTCSQCKGIFLSPENYSGSKEEKERYEKHNNDIEDAGYQNSVAPIVNAVSASFSSQHRGLDFGSGKNSVIKHLLQKEGFILDLYDPFFKEDRAVLSNKYDFITCCEVVEHFHHPAKEFKLLSSLLNPGGRLYCMTDLYRDDTDFEKWYYKNDKTHVFFYHPETICYIKENFEFDDYRIKNRLIIFEKPK